MRGFQRRKAKTRVSKLQVFEPLREWGRTDPADLSFGGKAARRGPIKIDRAAARRNADELMTPYEDQLRKVVLDWLGRIERVVPTKISGKKARWETRHWNPPGPRQLLEVKADHILPPAIFNITRWAAELSSSANPILANMLSEVAKAIYEGELQQIVDDLLGERVLLGPVKLTAEQARQAGGVLTGAEMPAHLHAVLGPGNVTFDESLKPIADAIKAHQRSLAGFTKTVTEAIRDQIAEDENAGASIQTIAANVADLVGRNKGYWADRVARTETTAGANEASLIGATQIPAVNRKQWLTAHDPRVRDSHAEIDGETIPLDETFSNGCRYPSDPEAPPEEAINCRCTLVYTIGEGDHEIDPLASTNTKAEHKYSPDQPRDEHGRFGSGGGASSTARTFAPITVRGVTWQGKAERKPTVEDAARSMVMDLSRANAEQRSILADMAKENAHVQDDGATYSAVVNGQRYNVTMERYDSPYADAPASNGQDDDYLTIRNDRPDALPDILDRVTMLAQNSPAPDLSNLGSTHLGSDRDVDIFVSDAAGSLGATVPGGGMMMLSDDMIVNPQSYKMSDQVATNWSPPNAEKLSTVDYVLTHEWGHLIDGRSKDQAISDFGLLHGSDPSVMSRYGASSPHEFYADAYADYQIDPATARPASLALAKEYGWTRRT